MGGDADNFYSFVVGLAVGGGTGKGGEKRGVNIEDSVFPVPNKVRGENFHKTSQNNEVDLGPLELGLQGDFGFEAVAIIEQGKREVKATGEGAKLGMIAGDEHGLGGQAARLPGLENSGSGMGFFGNEDGQTFAGGSGLGKAKSQLQAEISGEGHELGADLGLVEFAAGPRGEESHAKFSARDLFLE